MKLIIVKLALINFKGIKELTINFREDQTNIFAANEVGKTTLADAWHWLLTNKNSSDQKDFNIKNTVFTDLNSSDHQVSAEILADGHSIELKKVFREKWTKKRGEEHKEFTGHETLYFYNDVPCSQAEYQKKIADILPEDSLKTITNPLYFNSIKWQERRKILLSLGGEITSDEVLLAIRNNKNAGGIATLQGILNSGTSVEEYKLVIAGKKKKIKEAQLDIPGRIDEVKRGTPLPVDEKAVQFQIDTLNNKLSEIDKAAIDRNNAYRQASEGAQQIQTQIHQLKTEQNEIRFTEQNKINNAANNYNATKSDFESKVNRLKLELSSDERQLEICEAESKDLQEQTIQLRAKWGEVNAKELVFDEHIFECPACRRALPDGDIDAKRKEIEQNFIADKNRELDQITSRGQRYITQQTELTETIDKLTASIKAKKSDIQAAQSQLEDFLSHGSAPATTIEIVLSTNARYQALASEIQQLNAGVTEIKPADVSDLNQQKREIHQQLDQLKKQLAIQEQIDRAADRIAELEKEEKKLGQELADLERSEFLIEDFNRSKMDILESRINGKFKYVSFKMFDRQINGGEAETCETMYKDVPFGDLNTAGKIWAGIDIINALSEHFGVSAPIFLDNRESVSNIPETASQVINLIVSPEDKYLRVA